MSKEIDLPLSKDNLLLLLDQGSLMQASKYSHKQIAEWCEKHWNTYSEIDAPKNIEKLLPILADVETQWDLFLANTYSVQELQNLNFNAMLMPKDWFINWLVELNA